MFNWSNSDHIQNKRNYIIQSSSWKPIPYGRIIYKDTIVMNRIDFLFLRKKCHQLELGFLEDTWYCLSPLFFFLRATLFKFSRIQRKTIYSKPILFLITLIQPILSVSPNFRKSEGPRKKIGHACSWGGLLRKDKLLLS